MVISGTFALFLILSACIIIIKAKSSNSVLSIFNIHLKIEKKRKKKKTIKYCEKIREKSRKKPSENNQKKIEKKAQKITQERRLNKKNLGKIQEKSGKN